LSRLKSGDTVWCHNWSYIAEALERAIHLKGAKLVYHCHNSHALYAKQTKFQSLNSDAIIFNSEAMRQEVLGLVPKLTNTYTVHNGADETLFYPASPGTAQKNPCPLILFVGRLIPQKGMHVLMDALWILQERKVQAICKVVGSHLAGGSRDRMTPYIRSLHKHCPPNVTFAGFSAATDIAQEYRAADIFCCPSIWMEAFGNVNIEAMACGVPVVASRVGGIPEIAADGGVLLVRPNSEVELADALQLLIEDNGLRAQLGKEGLASFQRRFTWTVINRQYKSIIRSLWKCSDEVELS
jgi:spore coat protein SA